MKIRFVFGLVATLALLMLFFMANNKSCFFFFFQHYNNNNNNNNNNNRPWKPSWAGGNLTLGPALLSSTSFSRDQFQIFTKRRQNLAKWCANGKRTKIDTAPKMQVLLSFILKQQISHFLLLFFLINFLGPGFTMCWPTILYFARIVFFLSSIF